MGEKPQGILEAPIKMKLPQLVKTLAELNGSTGVIKKDAIVLLIEYSTEWNDFAGYDPEGRVFHVFYFTVLDETGHVQTGKVFFQNDECTVESWFEPCKTQSF